MTSGALNKDSREINRKETATRFQMLFRKNVKNRRIIFVLIIVLLTGATAYLGSLTSPLQIYLQGIAISLLTSLIFTLFYIFVVEAALNDAESQAFSIEMENLEEHVKESLDEALERRLSPLLGEKSIRLVDHWKELLPINYFAPSTVSNPDFQKALIQEVKVTGTYIFRGATAKFVANLLQEHGNPHRMKCQILILDPRGNAIEVHALDRVRAHAHENDPKYTLQASMERIRREIFDAINDLFALRERFEIELRTCNDNLFFRSEIFDNTAFISFYTDDRTTSFPPTYLYEQGTFYYRTFRKDFQQSWEYPIDKLLINSHTSQNDLEAFLNRLRGSGS